tara:strand:- start:1525 stop:1722 length:198 start_codon:yes stop_codon:yes gene_type:complete
MSSSTINPVQVTPNVRYIPLSDEDGDFGIFLVHSGNKVYHAREVHDRDEFERVYEELAFVYEQKV